MTPRADNNMPPNSRIFLTGSDDLTEEKLRESFDKYGPIEDIWPIKPRKTGEHLLPHSLWYIKFTKSSDALLAVEEMNHTILEEGKQGIKVSLAYSSKEATVSRGRSGTEGLERLFMIVSEEETQDTLRQEFSQYGKIVNCNIMRKRYAYVSFARPYEAALAIEGCDAKKSKYKPAVADPPKNKQLKKREHSSSPPPPQSRHYEDRAVYGGGNIPHQPNRNGSDVHGARHYTNVVDPSSIPPSPYGRTYATEGMLDLSSCLINNPTRCTRLFMKINYPLTRENLFKLCNLVPFLEQVDMHKEATAVQKTVALISYNSPISAALAWQKFQDFEYPIGYIIRIRYADAGFPPEWKMELGLSIGYPFPMEGTIPPSDYGNNINQQQYQFNTPSENRGALLKTNEPMITNRGHNSPPSPASRDPNFNRDHSSSDKDPSVVFDPRNDPERRKRSTVFLDPPKPTLPQLTPYKERCFFYTSNRLPTDMLQDIFSSFGDMIDVYYLMQKTCGFVHYGSAAAANQAIETLNGQIYYGEHFKVVRAEPNPKRDSTSSTTNV